MKSRLTSPQARLNGYDPSLQLRLVSQEEHCQGEEGLAQEGTASA